MICKAARSLTEPLQIQKFKFQPDFHARQIRTATLQANQRRVADLVDQALSLRHVRALKKSIYTQTMSLQIGDTAPDFSAETTQGPLNFHEWIDGSWCVFFSHPKNFTPVCTTELGYTAKLKPDFDQRGVKVIGLSCDAVDAHHKWSKDIEETQGYSPNFPMVADQDRKVASLYGMIHPNANDTLTVRSVFVIGPDKKIKLTLNYPASTGRNFDEILRAIDSLQLTARSQVSTPVN